MYLRPNRRFKDGKEHRYWSIVESKRCAGGKVVQRPVLDLGEINDSQQDAWCRVIEALDEGAQQTTQLALFPADRPLGKDDLQLRPGGGGGGDLSRRLEQRIEAHIFVAFLAYCLHVTLRARLRPLAAGLTPRAVLDKLAAIQMLDVHFPTTDGRTLVLSRYTEPNVDQKRLLRQLGLTLPPQPPPRIAAPAPAAQHPQPAM